MPSDANPVTPIWKALGSDIKPNLDTCLPCPFCSSDELRVVDWTDDDGEYYAIECAECKGAAPADTWQTRHGVFHVYRR